MPRRLAGPSLHSLIVCEAQSLSVTHEKGCLIIFPKFPPVPAQLVILLGMALNSHTVILCLSIGYCRWILSKVQRSAQLTPNVGKPIRLPLLWDSGASVGSATSPLPPVCAQLTFLIDDRHRLAPLPVYLGSVFQWWLKLHLLAIPILWTLPTSQLFVETAASDDSWGYLASTGLQA